MRVRNQCFSYRFCGLTPVVLLQLMFHNLMPVVLFQLQVPQYGASRVVLTAGFMIWYQSYYFNCRLYDLVPIVLFLQQASRVVSVAGFMI